MAGASADDLRARVERLERQLRELEARIEVLEKYTRPRVEHPSDQAAVREKVVYDWQG
jgi:phage shock protein A